MTGIGRLRTDLCARCGSHNVEVRHYTDDVDYRGLSFCVNGLVKTVCGSCKNSWETTGQNSDNLAAIKEAYSLKRDEIRAKDGLLTADQIALVVNQLGLTKAEAARVFGGGPNAFGKYLSGEVLQSSAMDRLLRLAYAYGNSAVEVLRMSGPELPSTAGYAHQSGWLYPTVSVVKDIHIPGAFLQVHAGVSSNTKNLPILLT